MMESKPYLNISAHVEATFDEHGDTHLGVGWPVAADVPKRYAVMLDVVRDGRLGPQVRLLDFGCGPSGLFEYLREHKIAIDYSGLDVSQKLIDLSREKFAGNKYYCLDILEDGAERELPEFDYVVMNGVFTARDDVEFSDMLEFFKRVIVKTFALARVGIAFNTMSKHVDWEREDLFHVPFDLLADFLTREVSRNFVFRSDYGLYEYTTYVYH